MAPAAGMVKTNKLRRFVFIWSNPIIVYLPQKGLCEFYDVVENQQNGKICIDFWQTIP